MTYRYMKLYDGEGPDGGARSTRRSINRRMTA